MQSKKSVELVFLWESQPIMICEFDRVCVNNVKCHLYEIECNCLL